MEVTLLIQAMDDSFRILEDAKMRAKGLLDSARILEDAREQAKGLLDSTVGVTSETRQMEKQRIQAIFKGAQEVKSGFQNFIATFSLLFVFWVLLSGKFDLFHLTIGVICSIIVAHLTHDLLFANVRVGETRVIVQRFIAYIPWLIYQIILANIYVAYLAMSPRMPIDPQVLRFSTKLESDISWVTLANSITLTPGTITMDIKDGEFFVHALDKRVADDLHAGEMEDRVAHIFMEADHIYIQDALDVARIYVELRKWA
ncbi:MAG: Na+/H+ antiporter subunit E [Syntrophobacterales bacterium]|nr:Na+/H+ antiporter subunit E [Syntrophobacterales bacterium]